MANSKKPPVGVSKPVAAAPAPVPPAAPKAVAAAPAPVTKPAEMKPEIKIESKPVAAMPAPVAAKTALPVAKAVPAPAAQLTAPATKPAEAKPVAVKPVEVKVPPAPVAPPKPTPAVEAPKPAPVAAKSAAPAPKAEKPVAAPKPAVKSPSVAPTLDVLKPVTVLQENVRASTEKAITVFRGQYAEVKTFAETATTKLEDSVKAAQEGSRALGFKFFEIAKAQTHAQLDHVKTVAAAKTLPEFLTVQQSFIASQLQLAQSGSKDVAALAAQVANDVSAPLRASLNLLLRR